MRILVLDDDSIRHDVFRWRFSAHDVVHAYNYAAALDALRQQRPDRRFDLACLDHDLGDCDPDTANFYVDPESVPGSTGRVYMTGLDVAFFLRDHPHLCPPKVLIHSWNPDGAKNMEAVIRSIPGVEVTRKQYGS